MGSVPNKTFDRAQTFAKRELDISLDMRGSGVAGFFSGDNIRYAVPFDTGFVEERFELRIAKIVNGETPAFRLSHNESEEK